MYNRLEDLNNKKVLSVTHTEYTLVLDMEDAVVTFGAYGDCCSQSFIESLDSPEVFNNATVLECSVVRGDVKDVNSFETHKWTFYKFKTSKGMCTLSFRNESNGYYDGWLELTNVTKK